MSKKIRVLLYYKYVAIEDAEAYAAKAMKATVIIPIPFGRYW